MLQSLVLLMRRPPLADATGIPTRLAAAVVAVLLVATVYADVIFLGASVSLADMYYRATQAPEALAELYPERQGRQTYHGFNDAGGATFQSEPAQQFMRYSIQHGESPYWNPYSGAGSLGPETLVDLKFSPFTLLMTLTDGSSLAFNTVFLVLNIIAVYFVFRILAVHFRLSAIAALAACVMYLLNGYNVANMGSNTSQVWLYWPICLYALLVFSRRPSVARYIGAALSIVPIAATTFLPTTIVLVGAVLFVACLDALGLQFAGPEAYGPRRKLAVWLKITALQGSAVVAAFALLAFLYLPIYDSMRALNAGSAYAQREFYPAYVSNILAYFTPKHFWESYNAINPDALNLVGNSVFHQGIVGSVLVSQAIRRWNATRRGAVAALSLLVLAGLGRVFGLSPFTNLVDLVPVLRNIGEQYVWIGVAFAFTLLSGFGFHALSARGPRRLPLVVVAAGIGGALLYTYFLYGLPNASSSSGYADAPTALFYVWVTVVVLIGALVLAARIDGKGERQPLFRLALLALLFAEMTFYTNHLRPVRTDIFSAPPDYIAFLKERAGTDRVASYGSVGLPPEFGGAYQIQQIESMNYATLPQYFDFFLRNFTPDPADQWSGFITLIRYRDRPPLNLGMLDMLSVRYMIAPNGWPAFIGFMDATNWARVFESGRVSIFENPNRYPRVFAVASLAQRPYTPVNDGLSGRRVAYTHDARLLEQAHRLGIPTDGADLEASLAEAGEAHLVEYRHDRVRARTALVRPAVVVLMDNWHPGWKAFVDGEEAYIGVVNESFRGIALPAGIHDIEMRYRPATLPLALIVAAATVALFVLLFLARGPADRWLRRVVPVPTDAAQV